MSNLSPNGGTLNVLGAINPTNKVASRTNLEIISEAETNERLAAKSSRPYVQSDGATANRASGIFVPGARGNLAAFPGPVTWAGLIRFPTVAELAGANRDLLGATSNVTGSVPARDIAWSFAFIAVTTGSVIIRQNGATVATDNNRYTSGTDFLGVWGGKLAAVTITLQAGQDPVVYIDNELQAWTPAVGAGTPPGWLPASMANTFHVCGYLATAGRAPLGAFGFGAFTAAERAEFVRTGLPPAWWMRGGSAASANAVAAVNGASTRVFSTFSAIGTNGFTAGTNTESTVRLAGWLIAVRGGDRLRVIYDYAILSGPGGAQSLRLNESQSSATSKSNSVTPAVGTAQVAEITANESGTFFLSWGASGNGTTATEIEVTNVKIIRLGAITHPAPIRDTLMVADATDLGNVPGRIVGGNVVSADAPQTVPLSLEFNYTGSSINLLGGVILPAGTIWEVVSVTGESDASVNLSLGTATSGTQIVNAQAVTAAPFRIGTFASQLINATSATGLWLTGSGNVAGRINVQLRKVK
jgi:hypothetical protein